MEGKAVSPCSTECTQWAPRKQDSKHPKLPNLNCTEVWGGGGGGRVWEWKRGLRRRHPSPCETREVRPPQCLSGTSTQVYGKWPAADRKMSLLKPAGDCSHVQPQRSLWPERTLTHDRSDNFWTKHHGKTKSSLILSTPISCANSPFVLLPCLILMFGLRRKTATVTKPSIHSSVQEQERKIKDY